MCTCGVCAACELEIVRRYASRPNRSGYRLPRRHPLTALRAYAATLAARVALPIDDVLELLAEGRSPSDILAIAPRSRKPIVTPTMRRLGR